MWQLSQRTDHPTPKTRLELGSFASICDAAKRIVQAEADPSSNADAIFSGSIVGTLKSEPTLAFSAASNTKANEAFTSYSTVRTEAVP